MIRRRFISIICIILSLLLLTACSDTENKNDSFGKLEGKNGDKKWISDIPGAVYVESVQEFSKREDIGGSYKIWTIEEEIEYLKNQVFSRFNKFFLYVVYNDV